MLVYRVWLNSGLRRLSVRKVWGGRKSQFSDSKIRIRNWIIIGSDRRPEIKQGIEGKIDRFRSGRVRVRVRVRDRIRVRFRSPI